MDFKNMDFGKMTDWEICDYLSTLDDVNRMKCLVFAAEHGSSFAMWELANAYEEGDGVEQDEDEAIKWYKLAAAHGQYEAICYLNDEFGLDYSEEPLEWCIKVAENGCTDAQLYLAEMYDGDNFEESLKWYKLAAEGGNRDAIYHLGHIYYYGDGVEQDYKQAYYWFDKDGFRDLPYYICADMYFYVDKNYETAFRLYRSALEEDGVDFAAFKIGEMYYYGLGVEQDYNKAFEFLKHYNGEFNEDFADEAPPAVHRMLGEMYKNGWGVEQNLEEAEKLLKAADAYDK
jgi:TPR repeat protein